METSKKKQKIILLIVLLLTGAAISVFFLLQPTLGNRLLGEPLSSSDSDFTMLDASTLSSEVGQELVLMLSDLRGITLNTDFVKSGAFINLGDFSQPIEAQPVGRNNPFAPAE